MQLADFCLKEDFAPTTITAMGHMQPSWRLDSSADIVGNAANSVDTGTDCTNDYVEIGNERPF